MRRKVLAVALVVAAVVALRVVGHARAHEAASVAPTAVPSPTVAAPSAPPSPPLGAAPTVAESGPHEDTDPAAAAQGWVRAWLDTSGGKPAWLARLKPVTDPPLLAGLAQTDIALVPGGGQAKVLAGTRSAPVAGQADATARVPTTAGAIDVTLTIRNEQWIVTSNDVAR